ncbi:tRNA (cytosine(38)-C(5))-methyltransferase-like [Saccoglossus kowalevskii]|uniref:tRNA (Cytosine(38)-C(5))-methyltransferase-like n=1 Tax=Saccoglossus kowalevskii TaxID=10224 RepID=A0ABM0M1T6_SACKO|nr:PREDICTED: tRNA (cytosine(38)-C(5))-methyltransferase-like [Saccoglossus kowalevskii]
MGLRVLELYSGIGGMHYAVKESGVSADVVAAVDINTIANEVYQFNFPDCNLMQRSIEGITLKEFMKINADVLLMSPPCQPFTRVGLQADSNDPRTRSFFHLLKTLQSLSHPPNFILVENVKGFETSDTRNNLIETLNVCKYGYQEFLLSPNQFGIPNSRLRYFLLAKRHPYKFNFKLTDQILEELPQKQNLTEMSQDCTQETRPSLVRKSAEKSDGNKFSDCAMDGLSQLLEHCSCISDKVTESCDDDGASSSSSHLLVANSNIDHNDQSIRCVREFLEGDVQDITDYLIPDKILFRFGKVMDIVKPDCRRSCCFTKAYHHYVEGTGSVYQMNTTADTKKAFEKFLKSPSDDDDERISLLKNLQLRYFTPREVANLMCFPPEFSFPESISLKQRYRLLGNSLNVHVVAVLLQKYLLDDCQQKKS